MTFHEMMFPKRKSLNGPIPVSLEDRFWPKVILMQEGCWGWDASLHKHGYGKLGVGGHGAGWICAHVASWMIHFGEIPDGLWVLHKCDNPECCRPDHLFLGTPKDNSQDALHKGRIKRIRRERVFSADQVSSIKQIYRSGKSITSVSKMYSVSEPTIRKIVQGKTYKEVA